MELARKARKLKNPGIQITALVDVLTILLFFFMFQYSTDPEMIKADKEVNLPSSKYAYATSEEKNINVVISNKEIKVNGQSMIKLSSGIVNKSFMHVDDNEFILGLHERIDKVEELKEARDQQWVIMADEKIPYETIKQTIYTLAVSGFPKIKLATSME